MKKEGVKVFRDFGLAFTIALAPEIIALAPEMGPVIGRILTSPVVMSAHGGISTYSRANYESDYTFLGVNLTD